MASEARSDLIISFLVANTTYTPSFRSLFGCSGLLLNTFLEEEKKDDEDEDGADNYYTCGAAELPQVKKAFCNQIPFHPGKCKGLLAQT